MAYKKYSDSTLLSLPKKELLEHLRCAEHNRDVAEQALEQQAEVVKDYVPVRHRHWAHLGGDEWCCTECGEIIFTEGSWEKPTDKYCNNCGAKMDEEVQRCED